MSEGLNRVMLLGNIGADPELKMSQGGTAVLKLRVACNERYQDKSGAWQDRTEWVSVVVFGKRAEGLNKVLNKGMPVFVEGAIRSSSYEDRDGQKRYKTEVAASKVLLCGGRAAEQGQPRQPAREAAPPMNSDGSTPADFDDGSDLPF